MPYLIDGNNLMAQTAGWHRDKAAARKRLIRNLAAFVAYHRAKVKVVFDGLPDDEFPEGSKYKSVHVLYARPGADADSRIKEILKKSSFKRDTIVVSSDRALASYVSGLGAKVMESGRFRKMLGEVVVAQGSMDKTGRAEPVDVQEWIEFFSKSKG